MARRNVGQPLKYAWVVAPDGHLRCFPLRAGVNHTVIDYEGQRMPHRVFDRGQFNWYIRPAARAKGFLTLEEAYQQDSRPELSAQEPNGKPAGFNRYMDWVDARERGAAPYEVLEGTRTDNKPYKRKIPKAYPQNGLPEVSVRRLEGITDDKWEAPSFPELNLEPAPNPDVKPKRKRSDD